MVAARLRYRMLEQLNKLDDPFLRRKGAFCERTRTDNPAPESRIRYDERVNVTWKVANQRVKLVRFCLDGSPTVRRRDLGPHSASLAAAYRSAEREFGNGYVGLLPGYAGRGNRNAKLP